MIGGNSVGDILHEHGFTGLRLGHNQGTLTFTDWREEIDNTNRWVGSGAIAAEGELLLGEQWCKVLEGYTVANLIWVTTVDATNIGHSKELLALVWWTNGALYHVTSLQTVALNLLRSYIYIIG